MSIEKGIKFKILKKFVKADDFKQYYVTGAMGGFRNPYDFRLTFFNFDSNEFLLKTQDLKQDEGISEDKLQEKLSSTEMPHILKCEIIMTEQAVRELYNFIGKELKIFEKEKEEIKDANK